MKVVCFGCCDSTGEVKKKTVRLSGLVKFFKILTKQMSTGNGCEGERIMSQDEVSISWDCNEAATIAFKDDAMHWVASYWLNRYDDGSALGRVGGRVGDQTELWYRLRLLNLFFERIQPRDERGKVAFDVTNHLLYNADFVARGAPREGGFQSVFSIDDIRDPLLRRYV